MKDIKMDNEKIKILAEQCIAEGQFAVGDFTKSIIDECLLADRKSVV